MKLIEKKIGVNLHDLGDVYIYISPKSQATNENIEKLAFVKIKNVCGSKDIIKKMKRQLKEWGKVFVNHTSD